MNKLFLVYLAFFLAVVFAQPAKESNSIFVDKRGEGNYNFKNFTGSVIPANKYYYIFQFSSRRTDPNVLVINILNVFWKSLQLLEHVL